MKTRTLARAGAWPAVCAFLVLASFSAPAVAAPDLLAGLSSLSGALDPLFSAARGMLSALVPVGWTFLSLALVLEAFTLVLNWWIKGGASEAIAQLARLLILTSIPMAMLTTWPELPNTLMGGFTSEISKVVTGGGGDGTDQISQTITTISQSFAKGMASATPPNTDAGMITGAITNALMAILLFLPLVLFIVALLFALYGPLILLYLGIILGPLLVPWVVWKPMDSLATKWLNFMLSSGVAFVVGIILAKIVAAGLQDFGAVVATAAQDGGFSAIMATILGMLPMMGMLLFTGYLLLKSESIAAALTGGSAIGAGGGLFGAGMRNLQRAGGGGGKPGGGDKPPPPKPTPAPGAGSGSGAGSGGGGQPASQASLSQQAGAASGSASGSAAASSGSGGASPGAAASTGPSPGAGGGTTSPGGGGGSSGAGVGGGSSSGGSARNSPKLPSGSGSALPGKNGLPQNTQSFGSVPQPSDWQGGSAQPAVNGMPSFMKPQSEAAGESSVPGASQDASAAGPASPGATARQGSNGGGGGDKPSRFGAAMTAARGAGEKIMSSPAGKYAAVGAAAAVAGPVGALAAGAFAVSPKLRANTGKAVDKLGELGGKASRALNEQKPKPTGFGSRANGD